MSSRLGTTLEMIKWEHSMFALPFALTGAMLAARWAATVASAVLDCGLHDCGAIGGDGV